MKLTKLAFLVASAFAVTACGGSSSGSDSSSNGDATSRVSQEVQVDRYSSADVQSAVETTDSSDTSTLVCLDTNNNELCNDETSVQTLDTETGTTTLTWDSSIDTSDMYIIATNKHFTYKVKASEAETSSGTRAKLYINPVTDAATRLGAQTLKDTVGYTGTIADFSATKELNEQLSLLADSVAGLTSADTTGVFDVEAVKAKLNSIFTKILELVASGVDKVNITINIVFDINNNPDDDTDTDTNTPPTASFDFVLNSNGEVKFTNNSVDPDGDNLQYRWSFGDNSAIVTDKDPTHTYTENGTYNVKLVVNDGKVSSIETLPVEVNNIDTTVPPTFNVDFTTKVDGLTATFTNTSTLPSDATDVEYRWDFGDYSGLNTQENPTHTYSEAGTYTVKLQVTSSAGKKLVQKSVKVESSNIDDDNDDNVTIDSSFTQTVSNLAVSFASNVSYNGSKTLTYTWDFGDGNTSTEKNPSHTYASAGSYNVTLTVSDGTVSDKYTSSVTVTGSSGGNTDDDTICSADDPFCKGDIDPAECQQECTTQEVEICDDVAATTSATLASVATPKVQGTTSSSIENGYYSTNPNKQVGVNKTITSMSDWTSDMIIAQGAANDDPRAFRGYHEKATDFYALYAAWDDTNLYLMVEMPNLDGAEPGGDFDYSSDQFLPMGIGIRTGVRAAGDGKLDTGTNVWTQGEFYSISEGIDTLLMFHPRLPTVNTPGLFKTNDAGLFSYDEENGYLMGFDEAGIERAVEHKALSSSYMGISDNYGKDATFYTDTSAYSDLLTRENASGHLYQITIPLKSIDITKEHIEQNGIAVVAFSTFGESMMDALPWTPNLVDNASTEYSKDSSTSAEKEDLDLYDVPLARIGKIDGATGEGTITPTPDPEPDPECRTETVTVCTPETLPESCSATGTIEMMLSHEETSNDKQVVSNVSVSTGYRGVTYVWEVTGQASQTTAYDVTTKSFTFSKGKTAKDVTITVTARNASGTKTGSESFSISIPACEGDACGNVNSDWISEQGVDSDNIKTYDPDNTCKAADGAIVLKADVTSAPNVYAYVNEESLTGEWPGEAMTKIDGCTSTFYQSSSAVLTDTATSVIFNAVGSERYPADMQPGIDMTKAASCFDWESKKALPAEECGLGSAAPEDTAYILRNGTEVADGSTITISYKEDDPTSAYVDVSLMVYGATTDASTEGTYSIDGNEGTFVNGQIIRVGENIEPAEDKASATPMTLVVKYGDATKTYKFVKVKWQKPVATTQFTWNNALVYFVMTDRFYNADTTNDNNFGRTYKDATGHSTATYHGGDIKGMTERLDYIKSLGMNAIWITAPYEQAHGWTGGGDSGKFAHWAYHGYYALDFTSLDPNVGTVEEFRTFVNEAHKRGMRVVLDIVMNHSGYATLQDMCDFDFGKTTDGSDPCSGWTPAGGQTWHNKPIDESQNSAWDSWWGKDWILFGGYGENCGAGDGLDACVSFLPDFKNSDTNGTAVSIPTFLNNKWATDNSNYDVPAAKQYRTGSMSVAQFQAKWLASWVEEFGIDGFRCDTAKHVTKSTWKLLKEESQKALEKWRANNPDDVAASWTDDFWMTGEHWGFKTDNSDGAGYASQGGFNSMINFAFNGQKNGSCSVPNEQTWSSYAQMYGVGSGSPKLNALSYVSSHDTSLCRPGDMKALGTGLLLLPGGVQVYYGDETARINDNGGSGGDAEHGTRSDMNFPSDVADAADWAADVDTLSTSFSSDATLAHWQKIGQFRFRNAAVGAGKQVETNDGSYCRTYVDETAGINNSVVIHVGSASSVDVGSCFTDGTELQDAYSGAVGTVSGGKVSLSGTGDLILLELKR